jgi:regulator of cell morphogenesis and NO signaling
MRSNYERRSSLPDLSPQEIVLEDYRAADIFNQYGIPYCCGARFALRHVCDAAGISLQPVVDDLVRVTRARSLPLPMHSAEWQIDFKLDYIVHVFHPPIRKGCRLLPTQAGEFAEEHRSKYPAYIDLSNELLAFTSLFEKTLDYEEKQLFPYISQLSFASRQKENFAGLLVRVFNSPVKRVLTEKDSSVAGILECMRTVTNYYEPPPSACIQHRVLLQRLENFDLLLSEHGRIRREELFPQALRYEEELHHD